MKVQEMLAGVILQTAIASLLEPGDRLRFSGTALSVLIVVQTALRLASLSPVADGCDRIRPRRTFDRNIRRHGYRCGYLDGRAGLSAKFTTH